MLKIKTEEGERMLPSPSTYLESTTATFNSELYETYGLLAEISSSCEDLTVQKEDDDHSYANMEEESLTSILNRPLPPSSHFTGMQGFKNDSDSEEDGNYESDSSSDDGKRFLLRKAIGIDPDAIRHYDCKYPPENGSQYLLAVQNHNRNVPKVVTADPKLLEEKFQKSRKLNFCSGSKEINGCSEIEREQATDDNSSYDAEENDDESDSLQTSFQEKIDNRDIKPSNTYDIDLHPLISNNDLQNSVLQEFTQLRAKIDRLRNLIEQKKVCVKLPENVKLPEKNHQLWQQFCLGTYLCSLPSTKCIFPQVKLDVFLQEFFSKKPELHPEELEEMNPTEEDARNISVTESGSDAVGETKAKKSGVFKSAHRPLLSILLNIDQRTKEQLINSHLKWLKVPGLIHVHQAKWIYALLACVQEPLEPNVVSDLREIAKKSISIRSKLCKLIKKDTSVLEKISIQDLEDYLTILSLFVFLVSTYFGQRDLSNV